MSSPAKINYTNGIVICHGKSEVCMVKYITSNLHLTIKQFSKDNGKHSIQITDLKTYLDAKPFKNKTSFQSEYAVEIKGKGSNMTIENFKLFIIMDTDDCTSQQKADFINKEMFKSHWLYDYIVPIYSIRSLEDVLLECGIMAKRIRNKDKGTYYEKIFPINDKPFSNDTEAEIKLFRDKIQKSERTNLNEFVDYCLDLAQKNKFK